MAALRIVVACLVLGVAWLSPVETVDSDPAVALLGAQSLLDHGTLRLDPYADRDELAYDLADDYRIRHYRGASYPNAVGVSVVTVPAVWLANRLGWHMLDQRAEFATQNALSAFLCAWLFILLFRLCRVHLGEMESLAVATVATFGTSVMSTGARALWNTNVALVFICLALLHLMRRAAAERSPNLGYLGLLLVGAFLSRPSSAIFGVACLGYLLGDRDRRIVIAAGLALAAVVLVAVLPTTPWWPWMAAHYAPSRLGFHTSLGLGLYGVLGSPSRGLFIFSPVLALGVVGALWCARRLRRDRIAWLCMTWLVLSTLMVAVAAGKWWGGHSFGPRLLAEGIPALVVLGCLSWRRLGAEATRVRRSAAAVFAALAAVSIASHTGQGLFNPATVRWNQMPDIDTEPALALDWNFPQFLASAERLDARLDAIERREAERRRATLAPYSPGAPIAFDADQAIFLGWYPPEPDWRWSRGSRASVLLRLDQTRARSAHVVELLAGALGSQRVTVEINGEAVGTLTLDGFTPVWRVVMAPADLLRPGSANRVDLFISDPQPTATDNRRLGVSLRQLRLRPVFPRGTTVTYADDPYFAEGFSVAESGWRWTDGSRARVALPMGAADPTGEHRLEIETGALGTQRVDVSVNGVRVGRVVVTGFEPTVVALPVDGSLLEPDQVNRVTLSLPDAALVPGDARRLGLAVVSVRLLPPSSSPPG